MARARRKIRVINGVKFDSNPEIVCYNHFKKKFKQDLTREKYVLSYIIEANYKPDFSFYTRSGKEILVEVKGRLDDITKRKMKAVKACHPDEDIRFVFDRKPSAKNERWVNKLGFPWAVAHIPQEWVEE